MTPGSIGNAGEETGGQPDPKPPISKPRWVRVSEIVALVLIVLFVAFHVYSGGIPSHGP